MKKIGLFGGTFNPIHNGHLLCPLSLVEKGSLDSVIFIPSGISPLKNNSDAAPADMRMDMIRLAIGPYPFFSASDIELKREGISYTIDTVRSLRKKLTVPEERLFLIIGTDWVSRFHEWKNYRELAGMVDFVVMLREGGTPSPFNPQLDKAVADKLKKGETDVPSVPVSSSEIRKRVRDDAFLKKFLPEPVFQYIRDKKLYL
jgi:nicotinate-nucleotide adenylyltransferase